MPHPAHAEQIGEIEMGWTGNDIIIEATPVPTADSVTCHIAYFDRSPDEENVFSISHSINVKILR